MDAWCPKHAEDQDTIKWLWKWKCIKLVTLLWFDLILSSHHRLGLPSDLFHLGFHTKTLYATLFFPIRATCSAQLILHDLVTRIIFDEKYRSLSYSWCSCPQSIVTSSLLGPNVLLSTLFSITLGLRSSVNVSDHVSHPNKTTAKIIVLSILIFIFLDSENKDTRFRTEW
jgi:hypothetical protein